MMKNWEKFNESEADETESSKYSTKNGWDYNIQSIMKYLKRFNEELDPETYLNAGKKLKEQGHTERGQKLIEHITPSFKLYDSNGNTCIVTWNHIKNRFEDAKGDEIYLKSLAEIKHLNEGLWSDFKKHLTKPAYKKEEPIAPVIPVIPANPVVKAPFIHNSGGNDMVLCKRGYFP